MVSGYTSINIRLDAVLSVPQTALCNAPRSPILSTVFLEGAVADTGIVLFSVEGVDGGRRAERESLERLLLGPVVVPRTFAGAVLEGSAQRWRYLRSVDVGSARGRYAIGGASLGLPLCGVRLDDDMSVG